jgi:hypothetical protein
MSRLAPQSTKKLEEYDMNRTRYFRVVETLGTHIKSKEDMEEAIEAVTHVFRRDHISKNRKCNKYNKICKSYVRYKRDNQTPKTGVVRL